MDYSVRARIRTKDGLEILNIMFKYEFVDFAYDQSEEEFRLEVWMNENHREHSLSLFEELKFYVYTYEGILDVHKCYNNEGLPCEYIDKVVVGKWR